MMHRPQVMGIVNVTPDSFSDGGRLASVDAAVDHALRLAADGADMLDIGGESTRPGAELVALQMELDRVVPVIEALRERWDGAISVDTMKPDVARAAVAAGAGIWNDVSALRFSPDSPAVAADLGCDVVLMHMRGEPRTMQAEPVYGDVVSEVADFLAERMEVAMSAGVARARLWVDPGIGFGKTVQHNLRLTAHLSALSHLGLPILYGASRKRMIAALDPRAEATDARLGGSIALALAAAQHGAAVIRVHDVRETVQALDVQAAIAAAMAGSAR